MKKGQHSFEFFVYSDNSCGLSNIIIIKWTDRWGKESFYLRDTGKPFSITSKSVSGMVHTWFPPEIWDFQVRIERIFLASFSWYLPFPPVPWRFDFLPEIEVFCGVDKFVRRLALLDAGSSRAFSNNLSFRDSCQGGRRSFRILLAFWGLPGYNFLLLKLDQYIDCLTQWLI